MAGLLGIGLDRLERQRRDVARLDEIAAQLLVACKACNLEQLVDIGRIVLGIEVEGVARLVGRRAVLERERQMDGLLVRARGIEIDMLGDLGLDNVGARRRGGLAAEIDLDHAAAGIRRGQHFHRIADPARRRFREIEIAIDAVDDALAAEGCEPFVDLLADRAEFRIGRVAERQHAELDAVEARRALAHQFVVGAHGARRRIALAPGGGDENELLGGGERRKIEIRHVDDGRLEAVLARRLGDVAGELFRISGLARINNGQRLRRPRRRCRLDRLLRRPRSQGPPEIRRARRAGSGLRSRPRD